MSRGDATAAGTGDALLRGKEVSVEEIMQVFLAAPRLCVFTSVFVQNLTSKLQFDINQHVPGNCFVLHADTRAIPKSNSDWLVKKKSK